MDSTPKQNHLAPPPPPDPNTEKSVKILNLAAAA